MHAETALQPIVFLSLVLVLGITAQWLAWRLQLPSILLLLGFGFLLGHLCGDDPGVAGSTVTDELIPPQLLFPTVSLAVAVILFEGGLTLRINALGDSGRVVLRLVTLGALITWILSSLAAYLLVGMGPYVSALTGAILVVTGPTVIGPLLRHVRPSRRIGSILQWEGIVIDPIGAVAAAVVFDALVIGRTSGSLLMLIRILTVGIGLGLATAFILVRWLRRYWIPDFLHSPVFLAAAAGMYALSHELAPEAGLVTVTVLGVVLANQRQVPVRHVLEFKENLRVLLISCLFIVLAARIRLDDLFRLGMGGALFLVVLIVLVRPLSVFLSTWGSDLTWQERTFLALLAPRGIVAAAVSSVFALEVTHFSQRIPDSAGLVGPEKIVPLTFLVIVGTVAFYGPVSAPLARWLGLAGKNPQGILFAGAAEWVRSLAKVVHQEGIPVLLIDTNYRHVAAATMAGLPSQCASIVSEYMEEIDLAGIGRLLSMTPNDDLNTLAAMEFAPVFGRENVYQLSPGETTLKKREAASPNRPGRVLFSNRASYLRLASRVAEGAQVKKTRITEEFTFADFQRRYGDKALVLFVLTETKSLQISTAESPLIPKRGQTVIALVEETDGHPAEVNGADPS